MPGRLFLTDDGNWLQLLGPARGDAIRPALFLDRDGVVVEETNYLCRAEDVAIVAGAAATIARANAAGWFVAIVANQSGIGRGYYDWTAFAAVLRNTCRGAHIAPPQPGHRRVRRACGTTTASLSTASRVSAHRARLGASDR